MATTLRALADLVGGDILGDAELVIDAARPLHDAGPTDITFLESKKYRPQLEASRAGAVVLQPEMAVHGKSMIRVSEPFAAFVAIAAHLHAMPELPVHGVDPRADIHPSAIVGANASIHAFATVGSGCVVGEGCRLMPGVSLGRNCRLGRGVTLHPQVVLYDNTVVGDRVVIHAHCVIGADGFGYRFAAGRHEKVPQLGNVEIGDDVEIGAGTTIDRGTFSSTRIGAGTKIDNLVMIAHNCRIGRHNILVSQIGIAGSASTGDYVVIAGQAGVIGHVHIGDGSVIGGRAGVTKDVPPGSKMLGSPATPEAEQKRIMMSLLRLPELRRELRSVQEKLKLVG